MSEIGPRDWDPHWDFLLRLIDLTGTICVVAFVLVALVVW